MLTFLSLAILAAAPLQQRMPPPPTRDVDDPGVVVTAQRVSPAGLQSVFEGRVTGVRFGSGSSDIWVAAPGTAYHLDWRSNRVLGTAAIEGRPGVHAIAVDPVTRRALVSSASRLPPSMAHSRLPGGAPLPRNGIVVRLGAFGVNGRVDAAEAWRSPPLGDYIAGAPAVAARGTADGQRYAILPLPANDALAVLDASTGSLVRVVSLGVEPIAAAISDDGSVAWVSVFGGAKPGPNDWSAMQCCDMRAEAVRVDARGIAAPGSVSRVDLRTGRVTHDIGVGRHPTALAWDQRAARLYVADGNSDSISVIDTRESRRLTSIAVAPFREREIGLAPTALALSRGGDRLFVALGGVNAVAVYDVAGARAALEGLIPTAWYPSSLDVSADGRHLAIGALLGVGSGEGESEGSPGKVARYVHAVRGSVNVVEVPDAATLAAYTTAVAQNNRLTLDRGAVAASPRPGPAIPRAVPERPGDPSPIRHVVFVIKENRTYDQVLGDLGRGDGDSSLVIYGREVTPNHHALAEQFVTLDRFFASGGNSADGHQWLTQANETAYPMWPLYYGRSYPYEGVDPLAYSSGGFLWESAADRGLDVAVFGEYAPAVRRPRASARDSLFDAWRDHPDDHAALREALRLRYDTRSDIPSLDRVLAREFPGWTVEVPDVVKASDVLAHLADWERAGRMPALSIVLLPNDHTEGTSPGWCTPRACVADNDYALGLLVDGLSHSSFWRSMAILAVEDDAQDGVDHVDGHRTVAFAISPYARRGVVDSTWYNQPSMVKTIELMLGLPALSLFDLVATDMRASFIGPDESPDFTPYTALVPRQSLFDRNPRVGSITGPHAAERRRAALASMRMRFDAPDQAPSGALNRILWFDARGWGRRYPGVVRSIFFPMAVDVDDDDREEVRR